MDSSIFFNRPNSLANFVGSNEIINVISENLFNLNGSHFYLISGSTGTGKTTLSKIIAGILQSGKKFGTIEELCNYNVDEKTIKGIKFINASNNNGIDDIRKIIDDLKYLPIDHPNKIIIFDECHLLTTAAQNALLTETEDIKKHIYYIMCTTQINKVIEALRRRAFVISLNRLNDDDLLKFLNNVHNNVTKYYETNVDINDLYKKLCSQDIYSPGLILQVCEKYYNGLEINDAVSESTLNVIKLCRSIVSGKIPYQEMSEIKQNDVHHVMTVINSYLRKMLVNSKNNNDALKVAKAMKFMSEVNTNYDLNTLLSSIVFVTLLYN